MIVHYVVMDAEFELGASIEAMEEKHNISIVNVTKFEIQLCKNKGEQYRGPSVYMFIGDWTNLVNYFIWDYVLDDIEELQELVQSIKCIEI